MAEKLHIKRCRAFCHKKKGTVLVTCLLLLTALSFVAASLLRLSIPNVRAAGYHKRERVAFYNAEAGVHYVVNRMCDEMSSGTLQLNASNVTVNYTSPDGSFEPVTTLSVMPDGIGYMFTVTGQYENAKSVIEASVVRPQLFRNLGVFGDEEIQIQPHGEFYSYDSRSLLNPSPSDSTGEANGGSNGQIDLKPHIFWDGIFMLGESLLGVPVTPPSGYDSINIGRIEPDPLGAVGGALEQGFIYYSDPANNDNATVPEIVNEKIDMGPKTTITLPGGRYYLQEVYLGPKSTMIVSATPSDPAIIYLDGPLQFQPNSSVNNTAGRPSNFFVFSRVSDDIDIQPNDEFRGFIYAPYAEIRLQPHNDIYGVLWGKIVRCQPQGDVYVDVSLLDQFQAKHVVLYQWRQLVNN